MEALQIFLVVMSCAPDLLSCENVSKAKPYADTAICRAARERLLRDGLRTAGPDRVIFAKCQYILAKQAPGRVAPREEGVARTAAPAGRNLF